MVLAPANLPLLAEIRRQLSRCGCAGEGEARALIQSLEFLDAITAVLIMERQGPPRPAAPANTD